jgi:hypothetical protein
MRPKLNGLIRFAVRMRTQRAYPSPYLCLLALALAGAAPSFATTWTVTDTNDSPTDQNSLRYAIANAASGDTIQFKLPNPSTIRLTNGVLTISNNLTIKGPGATQLAIDGNQASGVFYINSGVTVTISGLTVQNGLTGGAGAGIYNVGVLTLANSTVSNNMSTSDGIGGGIYNQGTLTLTDSTVSGNSTASGSGGGIYNVGMLTLTNSTVADNSAGYSGGGIYNGSNNSGTLTVANSTIAGNSAPSGQGGGIENDTGLLTIKSTLLANNGAGGNCVNLGGSSTSLGYNLSDDTTCTSQFFTQSTDINNTPAQLDPKGLQNNGGPTQTVALEATSPAVDHIPVSPVNDCTDTDGNPVTTDQRGISRPQGKGCDIGAYELVQTVPFSSFNAYLAIDTGRHPGFRIDLYF